MYDMNNYILQIRCLNQKDLSEYLKNEILSIDPEDITRTVFFKKLYVVLLNLPCYLRELNMKINESKEHFVNFWSDFNDNEYFYDTRRYIRINYNKLTNNGYIVSIPVKNGTNINLNIDIDVNGKNKIKCIYNMKSYEHEVCIANTLKYIHSVPKKEQDNEINAILKNIEVSIEKTIISIHVLNLFKNLLVSW